MQITFLRIYTYANWVSTIYREGGNDGVGAPVNDRDIITVKICHVNSVDCWIHTYVSWIITNRNGGNDGISVPVNDRDSITV